MSPMIKYVKMTATPLAAPNSAPMSATANVCNVTGIVPKGMVIQAHTVRIATPNARYAVSLRRSLYAVCDLLLLFARLLS